MNRTLNALALLILVAVTGLIFFIAEASAASKPIQDMVAFWAAARLARQDPYSLGALSKLEKSVGTQLPDAAGYDDSYIAKNPPWALPFFLPLGLRSYGAAYAAWTTLSVIVIAACGRVLWQMFTPTASLIPVFACLMFGPTFLLLNLGQSTVLVLLAVTAFLYSVQTQRDWMAGAALLLASIKPHITLLFLIAVALWAVQQRRWKIFAGGALALCLSSAFMLALNPHVFAQYIRLVSLFGQERGPHPNLGGLLYLASGWRAVSLLPELAGLLWVVFYWFFHRNEWDWNNHGLLVLVVSLVCSYHSYGYDEIMALPALLAVLANGRRWLVVGGLVLTNLAFLLHQTGVVGRWGLGYMFPGGTASAWLLIYLAGRVPSRVNLRPDAELVAAARAW
jgi:Glycosyltransferase family 87